MSGDAGIEYSDRAMRGSGHERAIRYQCIDTDTSPAMTLPMLNGRA